MIRALALSLAIFAMPAFAQEDHDHVAEANGLRAVHAWTNATSAATALVYVEIENGSDTSVTLTGAEAEIAGAAELVGLENADGELRYAPIPQMPITAGSELVLSPNGLAILMSGLSQPLVEGEHFEMELVFGETHLDVTVEIEAAGAVQHSHAGHSH